MNSFFDVFKWDRFVAPSAMELLFWLFSAIAVLVGIWGLVTGIGLAGSDPVSGLIVIAVSIIGTLAGIIAARIACEAIVILFRVNENLMDIAERGIAIAATPIVESEAVRLDHRPEARERASARAGAAVERPAIDHRPVEAEPAAAAEPRERDPFAPGHGRVEPKAWDVRPAEPKGVVEAEPVERPFRLREPAGAERKIAEARPAEPKAAASRQVESRQAEQIVAERRAPPTIVLPDRSEPKPAAREAVKRPPVRTPDPLIEHALRRLSEPAAPEALRASRAAQETQHLPEARPQEVDFLSVPQAAPPRPAPPPAIEDDETSLPAFIGARGAAPPVERSAEPAVPIELPPVLASERARRRNGHGVDEMPAPIAARDEPVQPKAASQRKQAAQDGPAAQPAAKVPSSASAGGRGPAGKGHGNRPGKGRGGDAPLKRRRPQPGGEG